MPRQPAAAAPLPTGFWAGPAGAADAATVLELLRRVDFSLLGQTDWTLDDVLARWRRPGFSLRRDTCLVRSSDGRVAAYGDVASGHEAWGFVHPDLQGRGIGSYVIDWIIASADSFRAGQGAPVGEPTTLSIYALECEGDFHRLLESRGFVHTRAFWRMRAELSAEPDPSRWPGKAQVSSFDVGSDAGAVHALIQAAFADIAGQPQRSFEFWSATNIARSNFDPKLWTVVRDRAGVVIAAVVAFADEGEGHIAQLAVARGARRQGIGLALLLRTFGLFWARGMRTVTLGVDTGNDTGAVELYERAGMAPAFVAYSFERDGSA